MTLQQLTICPNKKPTHIPTPETVRSMTLRHLYESLIKLIKNVIYFITAMDCYYHPKNPLLNFCTNPSCALPLCPKCINIHLSQSTYAHEIVSLNEAVACASEQIDIVCEGLANELRLLREDLNPNNILNDYGNMLQKHRQDALDDINRHYDYLQRQLLNEISTKYSQHLQSLVLPIEEQLRDLEKAQKSIKQHNRQIQTLIVVISKQSIQSAQDFLQTIQDRKKLFKSELPRLQDGEGGRLKMTSQSVDMVYEQRVSPAFNPIPPPHVMHSVPLPVPVGPLSGIDRIAQLEARLHTLRYA